MDHQWIWLAAIALGVSACGNSIVCGTGTVERGGECVAESSNNTTNNTTTSNNDSAVTCGPGTVLDEQDRCVVAMPRECGPGTVLDDQDRCIVEMPRECGPGTVLDANTAECVVSDMVCGAGTAFDAASASCLPTDEVCASGTTFDAALRVCMPDAQCSVGDVVLNGFCVSPVEALIAGADLTEVENDDPRYGGTPTAFDLPAVGDTFVLAGTIGEPTDLDGDMIEDQDVDVFQFTATAGQWITVSVQPVQGSPLGFTITGPDGYERFSPAGSYGAAREFVTRTDGDYQIQIAPQGASAPDHFPVGDSSHEWAATVEVNDPPAATMVDFSMPVEGSLRDLRANLLTQGGFTAGNVVFVDPNTQGGRAELILFDGATVTGYISDFGNGTLIVPASGEVTILVDWVRTFDPSATYEVVVSDAGSVTDLGALASGGSVDGSVALLDGPQFFSVDVPAGHVLQFTQTNDDTAQVEVTIDGLARMLDTLGTTNTFTRTFLYHVEALQGGTVTFVVDGTMVDNVVVTVTALQPTDLGTLTPPASIDESSLTALGRGESVFMRADVAASALLSGTLTSGGGVDVDLILYDDTGMRLRSAETGGGEEFDWLLDAGSIVFQVLAFQPAPSGWTLAATLSAFSAVSEVEPNDDIASANTGLTTTVAILGTTDPNDDWFSFDIATAANVSVTGSAAATFFGGSVEITNAAGEVIATGMPALPPGEPARASAFLEPGTYYVRVFGPPGEDYLLTLDSLPSTADVVDAGNNDDSANAQAVVPVAGLTIEGGLIGSTDADWYVFDLPAAQTFQVTGGGVFYDAALVPIAPVAGQIDLPMGTSYLAFETFTDGGLNSYLVEFFTAPENVVSSSPAAAIPDGGFPAMVLTDTITVPNGPPCTISAIQVAIDITHTWRGDLDIALESPGGTMVQLWAGTGGNADDLIGLFPLTLTPAEPLDAYLGELAGGDWTLTVGDTTPPDAGTLNSWGIGYDCQ